MVVLFLPLPLSLLTYLVFLFQLIQEYSYLSDKPLLVLPTILVIAKVILIGVLIWILIFSNYFYMLFSKLYSRKSKQKPFCFVIVTYCWFFKILFPGMVWNNYFLQHSRGFFCAYSHVWVVAFLCCCFSLFLSYFSKNEKCQQ